MDYRMLFVLLVLVSGCQGVTEAFAECKEVNLEDFPMTVQDKVRDCQELPDDGEFSIKVSQVDKCLTDLAVSEENLDICYFVDCTIVRDDVLMKDSRINYCFGNYAFHLKDPAACEAFVGDYGDSCFSNLNKERPLTPEPVFN